MSPEEKTRLRFAMVIGMLLGGLLVLSLWMSPVFAQEYETLPIPNPDGTFRLIEIRYADTNEESCGTITMIHCYVITTENGKTVEYIEFWRGHEYDPAILGGNAMTHEILHAWGITHAEMEIWFNSKIPLHPLLAKNMPDFPRETAAIQQVIHSLK